MNWNPTIPGHCASYNVAFVTIGIFNMITDLIIMLLPIPFLRKIQMAIGIKIGLVAKYNKCPGYKHLAADCIDPVKIIIVNGVPIVISESGSNVIPKVTLVIKKISDINTLPLTCDFPHTIEPGSYQLGEVDSDIDKEITEDDISLNCIRPTPSTHLSIIKCVPS